MADSPPSLRRYAHLVFDRWEVTLPDSAEGLAALRWEAMQQRRGLEVVDFLEACQGVTLDYCVALPDRPPLLLGQVFLVDARSPQASHPSSLFRMRILGGRWGQPSAVWPVCDCRGEEYGPVMVDLTHEGEGRVIVDDREAYSEGHAWSERNHVVIAGSWTDFIRMLRPDEQMFLSTREWARAKNDVRWLEWAERRLDLAIPDWRLRLDPR